MFVKKFRNIPFVWIHSVLVLVFSKFKINFSQCDGKRGEVTVLRKNYTSLTCHGHDTDGSSCHCHDWSKVVQRTVNDSVAEPVHFYADPAPACQKF
jgi:hypothetical protein